MTDATLEEVVAELRRVNALTLDLLEEAALKREDDVEWQRVPAAPRRDKRTGEIISPRCPVSGLSRSAVVALMTKGTLRSKNVGRRVRLYSLADMRKHIDEA
jgi:hypothetical protein